ncbi:E3 ubiquitin-protein ligase TRIM7-like [Varanus komodoensis]|uniref:E3 ubiquitin-protein ligase TRIM7-like n=1 Tax=Varanus komodoensis TaxID=61221 RepID=UPI001CF7CE46|nr:E3 ubiquitin-protein ligase TRIM7-like [Varanus komodoensis]
MATASAFTEVQQDTTCSICLDYLKVPVTVDCGHNFCHSCITGYCSSWEQMGEDPTCPNCRNSIWKENFRPNWQLANIVEKIKLLQQKQKNADLCEKHKERLDLFCKEDDKLVCWKCRRSPVHKAHTVLPKEEATEEYKDLLHCQLESLKKEKRKVKEHKAEAKRESQELLRQIKAESEKTVDQLRKVRHFLEEQEKFWLAQVEEVEKRIRREREAYLATLSGELSSLEQIIKDMEKKSRQPESELLKDPKGTLQRSKKTLENSVAVPLQLKFRISDFCDINYFVEGAIKQFKAANVTLNPHTAHPKLVLSEDRKIVRIEERPQKLPNNQERFDKQQFVLGQEGFAEGKHFWEVHVGSGGDWAVGVARKSMRRKGRVELCPEQGIWAVRYYAGAPLAWRPGRYLKGTYWAAHAPNSYSLSVSGELKRIQVCLSCDGGQVAFYDADQGTLIHTFSGVSFSGETLLPFFYICKKGYLRISP